jgi:hypothetical protein
MNPIVTQSKSIHSSIEENVLKLRRLLQGQRQTYAACTIEELKNEGYGNQLAKSISIIERSLNKLAEVQSDLGKLINQ